MGSLLDKLFPADSVKDVQKKMMEYGRENPDKSEAEIVKMFSGSMSRAKKAEAKQKLKDMPLPKSKPTKKQREAAAKKTVTEKTAMAYGGMAGGKKHMYAAGGMVKDNPGLKALKAASPTAYNKITGK